MRTEVIKADSIAEAAEQILDELKEDAATTARSISSRNNVIYFDGWDGLAASAVLRAVAQRLTAMASSDAPAGLQFDQIIHVDCSKWESRRLLQWAVAEQLGLPAPVMDMFDRQAEEDDFNGIPEGSRTEIPQVLRAMLQRIQELSHRFLVIFHNGSTEEIDLGIFGFLLSGYYSTAKVLWTFQGRFRLYPRTKVDRAFNKSSTETGAATDVFLSAVTGKEQQPQVYWSYLVRQEAADLVVAACKSNTGHGLVPGDIIFQPQQQQVLQGDMLVSDADADDGPWRAADALQREMLIDVEHWHHNLESLPSHLVRSADSMACMPYWTSPPYEALLSWIRDMFQQFGQLGVLKHSNCTFNLSSPPFLASNNLRILWLDHCQDDQVRDQEKEEDDIRRFFQRLWVLDVCYSCCDRILSAQMISLMTQLRELNVVGALEWDIGQLQGCLPNICKLRVTKSTVGCTSCSENDLSLGMNKMELLNFSGNRTMQEGVALKLSGISTSSSHLETVIIVDGCVGIQKLSFKGCAKLKNLLFSGLFTHLRALDLSGTAVKTLDLSAMTARLDELFLDDCHKLCAILWPPEDKRERNLQKLHIDTTWSAGSLVPMRDKSPEGITAAGVTTSSSASLSVLHGGTAPSEFNWCIRARDGRILRSLAPFGQYFKDSVLVHVEIYSPAATFSSGNDNKAASSNSSINQQYAHVNVDEPTDIYADVEVTFKDYSLLLPRGVDDASMLTQIWPCPSIPSSDILTCYTHIQDHNQLSTKWLPEGKQTMTTIIVIPDMICRNTRILHVHDSLSVIRIPGPAPALGSTWYYLNWCRIERCPKLEHVFTTPGDMDVFWLLGTFWASELPKARYIWNWTKPSVFQLSRNSFENFELLHMDMCPRVIHVLPLALQTVNRSLRNLKTLEIVWCGDLREVFPLYTTDAQSGQQQQQSARATAVHFRNLKRIHLHELPKLQGICGRWRISAPGLETVKIRGCWSLKRLPAVSSNTGKKVECDCEREWWDMLDWDGLDANHHPSLYKATHSQYYKKTLLKGSVLR